MKEMTAKNAEELAALVLTTRAAEVLSWTDARGTDRVVFAENVAGLRRETLLELTRGLPDSSDTNAFMNAFAKSGRRVLAKRGHPLPDFS